MASILRGSREALRQYPIWTRDVSILSPMEMDERQAGTMIEGTRHSIPIGIGPSPIGGATRPVTKGGNVAQANAESMGGIELCPDLDGVEPEVLDCLRDAAPGGSYILAPDHS